MSQLINPEISVDHQQVINAVFYKLKLAYPLKYKSAFDNLEKEKRAKVQWADSLKPYPPARILKAVQLAIEQSRYFVDLADLLKFCRFSYQEMQLKEPIPAYYEACSKQAQSYVEGHWSHVAVYLAGRTTGWWLLRTEPQKMAFPLFSRHYDSLCQRVQKGEDLLQSLHLELEDQRREHSLDSTEKVAVDLQQKQMQEFAINPEGGRAEFIKWRKKSQKSGD